jgi:peptidoglycan hydrolase-like protein with peptidoglycan-binding domain
MFRKVLSLAVVVFVVVSLAGCASTRKKHDLEVQGLKNQISVLESTVQSKDDEITILRNSLAAEKETSIRSAGSGTIEGKSRPSAKEIQTALKNAGLYDGAIDGKLGKKTRESIKAFQKANNIHPDGKVGKKTWNVLSSYLESKVK